MDNKELKEILKNLKKDRINKRDVAERTGFSIGYLSNLISGKKPITKQFEDAFEISFNNYIPNNIQMHCRILRQNLYRARLILGFSRNEAKEEFNYECYQEMYDMEQGKIPINSTVVDNIYRLLRESGIIDEKFDLEKQFLDKADESYLLKKSTDVASPGH